MYPNERQQDLLSPDFDRLVYQSKHLTVGSFRASVGHPRFGDSRPAPGHFWVFPRTAVAIQHEGQRRFVAGPPIVTYYNKGQIYHREAIAPDGDRCEWFALSDALLLSAVAQLDRKHDGDPSRPFCASFGPSDSACYYAQRRFVELCQTGQIPDALEAEEWAISVLRSLLNIRFELPANGSEISRKWQTISRERELTEQAKQALLRESSWHLDLQSLSQQLGCSAFHLCRVFRQHTGSTLHAYKEQARLRHALERLPEYANALTQLALDLGYASHSHFSAAFKKQFGVSPTRYASSPFKLLYI